MTENNLGMSVGQYQTCAPALMFGPVLLISSFVSFLKLLNNLKRVFLTDIPDRIPFLSVFFHPYFGIETQRGNQPLS